MAENTPIRSRSVEVNTFLTVSQVIQVLVSMLEEGKIPEAADLFSRCQEDVGYQLINQVQNDSKLHKFTANMFYRARDFEKAALCCEKLGEHAKAAQLYEQNDDFQSAAEMYTKVENFEKAAEMLEQNHNYRQAAELYLKVKNFSKAALNFEKAVSYFIAGKLYHELGKFRKSVELLQKIQSSEESFEEATILIADILATNGYLDLAINKLLSVTKGQAVKEENIGIYYHLAKYHKLKSDMDTANKLFLQIHEYDSNYKDVAEQLEEFGPDTQQDLSDKPNQTDTLNQDFSKRDHSIPEIVGVMDGFDFLRKVPLFEDLPLYEMKAFYHICEQRNFQDGEHIIEQGRSGTALYVIRSGKAVVQRIESGRIKEVAVLGEGDHLGEMSLVDESPTSARVVAKDPVVAFEISRDHFLRFLESNDRFAVRVLRVFIRTLCQRLRETTAKLAGSK